MPRVRVSIAVAVTIAACVAAPRTDAQSGRRVVGALVPPAVAVAESAQVARVAYRQAAEAFRRQDVAAAHEATERAARAWPAQPAYLYAAARLAALAGDPAGALGWLRRYAALGQGGDPAADSAFRPLARAAGFRTVAEQVRRNGEPLVRSTVAFTVADSTLHPEGIAFDPAASRWFVGSVRQRRIVAVDSAGAARDFVGWPADPQLAGVFGLAVDSARGLLWAATAALPRMAGYGAADRGRSGVVAYDLRTGRPVRRAWLPRDSADHLLGDLLPVPNGDVYTTDSQSPAVYVLRAGADSLELVARHPLLRSPQGMVLAADGASLLVADYSHGLLRVALRGGRVGALAAAPGVTTVGIDGLYTDRGTLIAVQNGVAPARVVRLCLDRDGRRVTALRVLDRNLALGDEPTLGVVTASGFVYVASSAWEKFDDAGARVPGTSLRPMTALRVPRGKASCGAP